jgi:HEAT repeat protein
MAQTGMRYELARQLEIHQMTIEESLARLREILDGDELVQRRQAIEALKFYGPVARSLEPYLLQALGDGDPKVRRDAAIALGAMPLQADDETVAMLTRQMVEDDDDLARQCALWALGEIGAPAAVAFPRVVEQLEDDTWDPWGVGDRDGRRILAAQTLARLDAEAAIPHLLPQLNEPRWFVRHGMLNALALCGPAALEPLRTGLGDARPRVHDSAAVALLKMGDRLTLAYAVVADAEGRPNDDFLEWAAGEAAGQFRRPGR